MTTPDTNAYLLLGMVVVFGVLGSTSAGWRCGCAMLAAMLRWCST